MEVFMKGKRWDKKKPTSDMNGDDWYKWSRESRVRTADDADFHLNRMKVKIPNNVTRHRIWPKPEEIVNK